MTDGEYLQWLTETAYGQRKLYTGTAKPPRGYIKRSRFQCRKLRKAYLRTIAERAGMSF